MAVRQSFRADPIALADPTSFMLFLVAGGFAALVNLVSRYLLTPVIGYDVSIVVAYLVAMPVGFLLFRMLVFGRSGRSFSDEIFRFIIVNIVSLTLVWFVSVTLARIVFPALDFAWHAEDIAHFVGTCVPALSSYVGHSIYTFRSAASLR
jgi:putative flippase GtrA